MTDWKWFKAFVRRPGDQPLRIDTWSGGTTGYRYNQSWELLAANRHRVHTLCIRLRYDKKRLDNFFSQSAPRLEVLYLNRDGASGRYYHIQHPQPYIMPKLRELHIRLASTGDIGSLPPLIPTVTTITLSGCCHQMESEVLRRCPALRCLTIEDTQYSWIPLTGSAPLVLPELRTLQAHRAYLSTIISLPLLSLLQMEVSIVCPRDNLSQITQDFSTLLSACPNVQLEQRSFDLTYRYSSFTVTGQYTAGQGPISLGVVCPTLRDDDSLIIANSFVKLAQIVKAPICSIYVDDNGVIGGKLFYLFRDFADITMLRIDGQELFTLFLSLVDHSNAPCATEIAPLSVRGGIDRNKFKGRICTCQHCCDIRTMSYPDLETLVLLYIWERLFIIDESKWLDLLLDWLKERLRRGLGPRTLRYVYCEISQSFRDRLESMMDKVVIEDCKVLNDVPKMKMVVLSREGVIEGYEKKCG